MLNLLLSVLLLVSGSLNEEMKDESIASKAEVLVSVAANARTPLWLLSPDRLSPVEAWGSPPPLTPVGFNDDGEDQEIGGSSSESRHEAFISIPDDDSHSEGESSVPISSLRSAANPGKSVAKELPVDSVYAQYMPSETAGVRKKTDKPPTPKPVAADRVKGKRVVEGSSSRAAKRRKSETFSPGGGSSDQSLRIDDQAGRVDLIQVSGEAFEFKASDALATLIGRCREGNLDQGLDEIFENCLRSALLAQFLGQGRSKEVQDYKGKLAELEAARDMAEEKLAVALSKIDGLEVKVNAVNNDLYAERRISDDLRHSLDILRSDCDKKEQEHADQIARVHEELVASYEEQVKTRTDAAYLTGYDHGEAGIPRAISLPKDLEGSHGDCPDDLVGVATEIPSSEVKDNPSSS